MKKVRIFFALAALVMASAGVFAFKVNHEKAAVSTVYYFKSANYYELLPNLITTTGTPSFVGPTSTNNFPLYDDAGGTNKVKLQ